MSDENETLETPASEVSEQPEVQTVESVESTETETSIQTPEGKEETTSATPRKFAGKYETVEELERAYQNSQSEGSRMAQQLAQVSKPKPEATTPKFSSTQLEDFKEGRLLEVSNAQTMASRLYAEGNYAEAQKYEAVAKESARQIRLIDAELRKMDIEQTFGSQKKAAAEARLLQDATSVLQQHRDQLVPGTDLHSKASEFMEGFVAMGMDAENALVQAQAVSLAAQVLGLSSKTVAVNTRKELTKSISKALKEGVASGAGKAASGNTAQDFMKMTDKEFREYKAKRGWD
jgi:hypothetical protein